MIALEDIQKTRLLIVIVCYRTPELTIDCLHSLESEIATVPGASVAVCENGSGRGSAGQITSAIARNGWSDWARVTVLPENRGFTGGNNAILRAAMTQPHPPDFVMLLNSDTLVRRGALGALVRAAEGHPNAGIVGPRLEWPDGTPQQSCFADFTPSRELLRAARTSLVDRIVRGRHIALPVSDVSMYPEWISFACVLIRQQVLEQIGLLDEGFFLYFDDSDYCRRARQARWKTLYWPEASVVHLRGQSGPVKSLTAQRKRRPPYWYQSRTRYYAKYYGQTGLLAANLLWTLGRCISWPRELIGSKKPHICEKEWLDIWTNCRNPLGQT